MNDFTEMSKTKGDQQMLEQWKQDLLEHSELAGEVRYRHALEVINAFLLYGGVLGEQELSRQLPIAITIDTVRWGLGSLDSNNILI